MASGVSPGGVILVDAHALVFQSFHAIPAMTGPDGRPTNALFGFTRDLFFMRDELKPDYLLCAFDLPGPTFRSALYPDYKAHRTPRTRPPPPCQRRCGPGPHRSEHRTAGPPPASCHGSLGGSREHRAGSGARPWTRRR